MTGPETSGIKILPLGLNGTEYQIPNDNVQNKSQDQGSKNYV